MNSHHLGGLTNPLGGVFVERSSGSKWPFLPTLGHIWEYQIFLHNMNNFEIVKSLIGEGTLVQSFKQLVKNQTLQTSHFVKVSPKCHSLLSMLVTSHKKSFVLT